MSALLKRIERELTREHAGPDEKTEIVSMRMRRKVKERLELLADADSRSMTNYLEWLIMQQPLTDEGKRK